MRPQPVLVALLITAVLVTLLRNAIVQSNLRLEDDVPPYPVFVLAEPGNRLLVVEHSRNQLLQVGPRSVETIAGNGRSDFTGDGGPAIGAGLFLMSVARDGRGNLYIADHNHHRIRRIDSRGRITTIAGTGQAGYGGDGGLATAARLDDPAGVAVDDRGNLWIADSVNNRIRKVTPDGRIQTAAGTGEAGFGGDGGPAIRAKLDFPWGLSLDSTGRLLIADTGNNRIRAIEPDGTLVTLAGSGEEGFGGDGGPALHSRIERPQMVVADSAGNLYIADTNNNRIRRVDQRGIISTLAGNGTDGDTLDQNSALKTGLSGPYGVSIAGDRLYVADTGNYRVLSISRDGHVEKLSLGR